GYEFTITANVTDNWSFNLNYSHTSKEQSNVGEFTKMWAADESEFWLNSVSPDSPNDVIIGEDGISLAEEVEDLNFWISDSLRPGDPKGLRPDKFNVFTNYNFRDGLLKGFAIGGGYRWLSENLMGWLSGSNDEIWGQSYGTFDLMMRYRTKLSDKYNLTVQLNIQNLLDEDSYLPGAYLQNDPNRGLRQIYLREPLDYQLTTTISF
ncbi:MAG: TonB-dependent receptor, partial [Verrucomicrobiae bacterium]|nr:TonB-dependent receptor [Verrucomicrobiae bacterium]